MCGCKAVRGGVVALTPRPMRFGMVVLDGNSHSVSGLCKLALCDVFAVIGMVFDVNYVLLQHVLGVI